MFAFEVQARNATRANAAGQGHDVVWDEYGDWIAHRKKQSVAPTPVVTAAPSQAALPAAPLKVGLFLFALLGPV